MVLLLVRHGAFHTDSACNGMATTNKITIYNIRCPLVLDPVELSDLANRIREDLLG